MSTEHLTRDLVAILEATRRAERDLFGKLDPAVRDRPVPGRDWSPKDHQAHLTAWKARQAERFTAARRGREMPVVTDEETDAVNAQLHATRADWRWEAIEREADDVAERLNAAVLASDPTAILASEPLIRGVFGNGADHAQQHFAWLLDGEIGLDSARVATFVEEVERLVRTGSLPEPHRTDAIYNLACFHARTGRREAARPLLREVLPARPDLFDWAQQDPDLTSLRGELAGLADQ